MRPARQRALLASQHVWTIAKHLYLFQATVEGLDLPEGAWEHASSEVRALHRESALAACAWAVEDWHDQAHEAGVTAAVAFDADWCAKLDTPSFRNAVLRGSYIRLVLMHCEAARWDVLTDPNRYREGVVSHDPPPPA
jgi:hypothetical protein